jgi:hypothetical protein
LTVRGHTLGSHSFDDFSLNDIQASQVYIEDSIKVDHLGIVQQSSRALVEPGRLYHIVQSAEMMERSLDCSNYIFFGRNICWIDLYIHVFIYALDSSCCLFQSIRVQVNKRKVFATRFSESNSACLTDA